MYWLRTTQPLDLIAWLLMCSLWICGGWLLVSRLFRLRPAERVLVGLASGWLLFIVLSNLAVHFVPLSWAYWLAATSILAAGLTSVWVGNSSGAILTFRNLIEDLSSAWPALILFGLILVLAMLINRGLAIFDDYHNLPLVARMAAGDAPPHFYLDPGKRLAYHYGLHLFAASLVRAAGFFPWSAFDLSKSLALALTASLSYVWFRRQTRSMLGGVLGMLLVLLAGGARWLLLFFPSGWLIQAGAELNLLGSGAASGANLYAALANPWNIDGSGPMPFPFAFANGIFPPLVMAMGGSAALPQATLFTLLFLAPSRWRIATMLVFSLLLASLALSAEQVFLLAWGGLLFVGLLRWLRLRNRSWTLYLGVALLISMSLAILAGGVITEIARGVVSPLGATTSQSAGFASFGLRWPPGIVSAQLGLLAFANASQTLILLLEMGVVLLLAPAVSVWCWRHIAKRQWMAAGLGIGAVAAFIAPILIRYGVERDITRITASALFIWLILGYPLFWWYVRSARRPNQIAAWTGYAIAILGGIMLTGTLLIAVVRPVSTYFVTPQDAQLSKDFYDRLEVDAQVFDTQPYRAVTLFGRVGGRSGVDHYTPMPEWQALVDNPSPKALAEYGYDYAYLDKDAWQGLSPQAKQTFRQPCVKQVASQQDDAGDFRWLLNISACR